MISEAEIAAARSRIPLPELIGRDVALKRRGKEQYGLCPFHNERTPSFYVFSDHYHCFGCGAHGNAISYLMRLRNLDFPTAVHELAQLPAVAQPARRTNPTPPPSAAGTDRQDTERVAAIMRQSTPITPDTDAYVYLVSRGLSPNQPALRAHAALYCHEVGGPLPAVIAPLTNSKGEVTAVQRIWCRRRAEYEADPGGHLKMCRHLFSGQARAEVERSIADVPDSRMPLQVRKKTLGEMQDGAVRLAPAGRRLGLAEGVESAVAASMLYRMPVWAVCGAARLATVWVPDEVEVWIMGDNGDTGHALAQRAVEAHEARGRRCGVIYPAERFGDFADMAGAKR